MNLDAANIKVPFAWYNCSAGDDKKIIVSAANIRFEEACVVFNVAACYIQLAGMESMSTSEGLKRACNYYMLAAGIFQFISENLTSHFDLPTPADVSPMSLNFLSKWSLAAAQECFVLKGIAEKIIKDGMIAKLSLATGQMYDSARDLGEALGIGSIYGKVVGAYLLGRANYFKALAQTRKASEALSLERYGEEISRLQEANQILMRCKEHKRLMDPETVNHLDNLAGQITRNLERASKDNSIIYHEAIPAVTGLADIGQAVVARASAVPDWTKDPAVPSRSILARLVPETIRVRAVEYYDKRNEAIEEIYGRLRGLKHTEMEIMQECNLPSLLDISSTSMGLPSSLLEKSQQVRANGGSESLYSSMTTVETLKGDAKQLLQQVEDLLKDENASDMRARREFPTKWTRPESTVLAKKLYEALESYKKSFIAAGESDSKLQKVFDESIVGITALDSSQSELEASIPASTSHNSQRGNAVVAAQLKSKLELVATFEPNRLQLSELIQAYCAGDQVEGEFTALGEEVLKDDVFACELISGRVDCEAMRRFRSEMDRLNFEQQSDLSDLRNLAISFAASLTLSSALEERRSALQTLDLAFSTYTTLTVHLQEAMAFYSGLLDLLQKLRENTRDFTVSRGIEMEEIRESLVVKSAGGGYTSGGYPNVSPSDNPSYPSGWYPYDQQQQAQYQQLQYQDHSQYQQPQYQDQYQQQQPMVMQPVYMMPTMRSSNQMGSVPYMMQQPSESVGGGWQPGMPVQYVNTPMPVPMYNNDLNGDIQPGSHGAYPQTHNNVSNDNNQPPKPQSFYGNPYSQQ